MKISELTLLKGNPRQITKENLERLKRDMQDDPEFLKKRPVLVNKKDGKYIVYAGNMRTRAAKELGWKEIPTDVEENLSEEKMRKRVLRDNQEYGEWDNDELANSWEDELKAMDLPELDIEKIIGFPTEEKDDEVPEVPEEPTAKLGDIYQLGKHRIMCGDSTKVTDLEELMKEDKARLILTDPPYGVDFKRGKFVGRNKKARGESFDPIINDELKGSDLYNFILRAFSLSLDFVSDASIYVWTAPLYEGSYVLKALLDSGIKIQSQIIWNKSSHVIGRSDYHWKHEVCWYGWEKDKKHSWYGERKQNTVWEAKKGEAKVHPTMKPVELLVRPIINSSKERDIVLDIFLGSGSTLIAAEKTNRVCYGMELDPKYIDVIIKRWEEYTGDKAIKINK